MTHADVPYVPVFTRYLYDKRQVLACLDAAVLQKQKDEALFWLFELFWSGFADDAWAKLQSLYDVHFRSSNPKYGRHLATNRSAAAISAAADRHLLIGSVVMTLCMRDRAPPDGQSANTEKFVFRLSEAAAAKFDTVSANLSSPREVFKSVSRYPVRCHKLGADEDPDQWTRAYLGNWLDHCAAATPYWRQIIGAFGGALDTDARVRFADDASEEMFYAAYGYEPDEQSAEMHRIHGVYL